MRNKWNYVIILNEPMLIDKEWSLFSYMKVEKTPVE